jgi:hypothetical protein
MTIVAFVLTFGWLATAFVLWVICARIRRLARYCSGSNAFIEICVNSLLSLRQPRHSGWPSLDVWFKLPWPKWGK